MNKKEIIRLIDDWMVIYGQAKDKKSAEARNAKANIQKLWKKFNTI